MFGKASTSPLFSRPSASVETAPSTRLPGATRSGLSRLSRTNTPSRPIEPPRVGPRELKLLTTSSARVAVARGLALPTVIAAGSLPGELMVP